MIARRSDLWGLDALWDVVGATAILTAHANASITLLTKSYKSQRIDGPRPLPLLNQFYFTPGDTNVFAEPTMI